VLISSAGQFESAALSAFGVELLLPPPAVLVVLLVLSLLVPAVPDPPSLLLSLEPVLLLLRLSLMYQPLPLNITPTG